MSPESILPTWPKSSFRRWTLSFSTKVSSWRRSNIATHSIFLLRHAESAPSREIPESDWPLSKKGESQVTLPVPFLESLNIDLVFSSPFIRAVETVSPHALTHMLRPSRSSRLDSRKKSYVWRKLNFGPGRTRKKWEKARGAKIFHSKFAFYIRTLRRNNFHSRSESKIISR